MTEQDRQIELEREAVGMGMKRYRDNLKKNGPESTPPGLKQTKRFMWDFVDTLEKWTAKGGHPDKCGTLASALRELPAELVCFITIKRCIHSIALGKEPLTALANDISRLLLNERNAMHFVDQKEQEYKRTIRKLKKCSSYRHRSTVMTYMEKFHKVERSEWSADVKEKIGLKLIEMLLGCSDMFVITSRIEKKGTVKYLEATDDAKGWFEDAHKRQEIMTPVYQPMVVPPRDWSTPNDGGYFTHKLTLIKTRDNNYLEELTHWSMPNVYKAINTLQKTSWRVNKKVYDVVLTLWEGGSTLGGLPPKYDLPKPSKPADIETNDEARVAYRKEAARIWDTNITIRSQRHATRIIIATAGKYTEEPALYFPYTMDWRGRIYAVPTLLNPQGSDVAKGVLEFSIGKPLGASGAQWLMIHVAGLFGVDKVTMGQRIQWVHDNIDALLDSARNPLDGGRFWTTADKPFQALAAIFELAGYWEEGESYESHIPIALDGSCNGVQNFSAMLRDPEGGALVNMISSELPQDLYGEVAKVVAQKVAQDAADGVEHSAVWVGRITRKLVKRPVMTLPYGATRSGMRDQMIDTIRKGEVDFPREADRFHSCQYLSGVVYKAIGEVVKAARLAMDWLQDAAKIAAQDGIPIHWVTPAGLPVLQSYHTMECRFVNYRMEGYRMRLMVQNSTKQISKPKMQSAISPNFVHSMDASHLMLTVCAASEVGISSFSMIHDSYATHAADTDTLAGVLRDAFITQYETHDVLEQFRGALMSQLSDELSAQITPIPTKGTLDLNEVKSSVYFFA